MDDHWAAAMAVLATEKALTRLPSGRTRSLKHNDPAMWSPWEAPACQAEARAQGFPPASVGSLNASKATVQKGEGSQGQVLSGQVSPFYFVTCHPMRVC